MSKLPKLSGMTLVISAPLLVMSFHIYEIYQSDHWLVRIMLAIGFDLIVIALYRYLDNRSIKRDVWAYRVLWSAILLVAVFQMIVNIYAYWFVDGAVLAVVKGGIFPLLVNMVAFVDARKVNYEIQIEERIQARQNAQNSPSSVLRFRLPADETFRQVNLTKAEFESLIKAGRHLDELRLARNWKSLKRWSADYGK
jgi:uncharacterized BrkB/YihY/UPF0761 family membrane protein